jgi:hypothetical protein
MKRAGTQGHYSRNPTERRAPPILSFEVSTGAPPWLMSPRSLAVGLGSLVPGSQGPPGHPGLDGHTGRASWVRFSRDPTARPARVGITFSQRVLARHDAATGRDEVEFSHHGDLIGRPGAARPNERRFKPPITISSHGPGSRKIIGILPTRPRKRRQYSRRSRRHRGECQPEPAAECRAVPGNAGSRKGLKGLKGLTLFRGHPLRPLPPLSSVPHSRSG